MALDSWAASRDTDEVPNGGSYRKVIAGRLNAAYAAGLLSQDTYVRRIDELLGSAVVDPSRLSGDLAFRRSRNGATWRITRILDWLRGWLEADAEPPMLLGLDWNGGTSEMSIGRDRGCDLVLRDPEISRRHAQLRFRDGRWILRDLDSTNGTFVNGVRVGRCQLQPGDYVSFGSAETLMID
jgi:hypothetical protein